MRDVGNALSINLSNWPERKTRISNKSVRRKYRVGNCPLIKSQIVMSNPIRDATSALRRVGVCLRVKSTVWVPSGRLKEMRPVLSADKRTASHSPTLSNRPKKVWERELSREMLR